MHRLRSPENRGFMAAIKVLIADDNADSRRRSALETVASRLDRPQASSGLTYGAGQTLDGAR